MCQINAAAHAALAVCKHRRRCAPPPSATARSPSRSTRIPSRRPASCSSACGPPGSTAPTCSSSRATTRRRPARRPTSPGSSWPARSSATGRGVTRFELGDRVMAVVGGGGQGELALVHERAAMPVPDELDWTAAGGVPGGVHDRARRALHAGRAHRRRARARARRGRRRRHGRGAARHDGRRARHRDGARPARARADRRARRQRDRARGLRGARPVRRHPRARRRAEPRRATSRRSPSAGGSA